MVGNDTNVEPPKGSEDMSSEWVVNGNNMSNTSSGIITMANSMMEVSSCPSAPMVDSFCPPIWNQPINGQSLGYGNMNVQNDPRSTGSLGHARPGMSWMPNAMLRDSVFLPTSLPPFPADSAFIERAARFSCFNGGNYSEMVNPFSIPDPLNPHPTMQEVFTSDGSKQSPGIEPQNHEISKEALLLGKNENQGNLFKKSEGFTQSHDEVRNEVNVLNNQCDEAEFSGRGAQEELASLKKRKRTQQIAENSEAPKPDADTAKEKGDQNPSSTSNHGGKHGNQEPQGSDPPKEDYIHVRARRGQATNSHSLAERIRREKISERMKFLQDLVPGCSKVTGKAVMLDEIINYVQSLQRQVEFLSMKLATVNPRLDFNMEGFLSKDIVQSRASLSSLLAFPPDIAMHFPPLHPPQHGLNQAGFQRPIGLDSTIVCGGLSEPTSQHMQATASVWDTELHNVVHNSFDPSAPSNTQDLSDHTKAEP